MSYVGLATTNFLLFLSSFFAYFVPYYYDTNLIAIWMASNICLYFSLWIAILSLILAQYDGIPWFSHLITLVFGVLIGLVLNPDNFSLSNENGIYQASYSWEIGILALFLYLSFFIFALKPLLVKAFGGKIDLKKKHYFLLIISYLIITSWVVTLIGTSYQWVRTYRTFALSFGMGLWSFALYLDPKTIVITNNEVQKILILTETGIPLLSYDFIKQEEMNSDLVSGLLSAITSSSKHIFSSDADSSLESMEFDTNKMNFIQGENIVLILVSSKGLSSNLNLISRLFIEKFEAKHKKSLESGVINVSKFSEIKELINEIMESCVINA